MDLNIDALHKVPEILDEKGSFGRQWGKTTYCLYTILGYLQVLENEDIVVLISHIESLDYYYSGLYDIFKENNLKPMYDLGSRRIRFSNNSNRVKFISTKTLKNNHPGDFIGQTENDLYLITDLEEMPPYFYHEEITIRNCEILNKYIRN